MKNTDQHIAQNVNTGLSDVNQPDEISLFDVFDILLKFKWLFVISFFVVLLGGLFIVHRLPVQKQYTQYISMPSYTDGSGNRIEIIDQDEVSMTIKQMIAHGGLSNISVTTPISAPKVSQFPISGFLQLSLVGNLNVIQAKQRLHQAILLIQHVYEPLFIQKRQALMHQKALFISQLATLSHASYDGRIKTSLHDGIHSVPYAVQLNQLKSQLYEVNAELSHLQNIKPWGMMAVVTKSHHKLYALPVFLALFISCLMVFIAQCMCSYRTWRKRATQI